MLTFAFISEAGIGGKKDGALALTAVELLCKDDLEHEDCCVGQSVPLLFNGCGYIAWVLSRGSHELVLARSSRLSRDMF